MTDEAPAAHEHGIESFRSELIAAQNLPMGIAAGAVAALVSAALWAVVTITTGYTFGLFALGVGILVGLSVRAAGKGVTTPFGVAGAVLALAGSLLGDYGAAAHLRANFLGVSYLDYVSNLSAAEIGKLVSAWFSPLDLLFYAIATYEGYQLSFRQVGSMDVARAVDGAGPEPRED